ncbi:MAG: hypothetical protein PWR03_1910 [Tenuifilum sp.]|jgi:hypothetical protein|nr:hypothetical protein [Tenuifilum sp.]
MLNHILAHTQSQAHLQAHTSPHSNQRLAKELPPLQPE